jgi:hypothetical protein
MSQKILSAKLNGDGHVHVRVVRAGDATRNIPSTDGWRVCISNDRPVYRCPNCDESAVQFYRSHDLHPGLKDFFRCHACGSCWEM